MMLPVRATIDKVLQPVPGHRKLGFDTQIPILDTKVAIVDSKCSVKELVHTLLGTKISDLNVHDHCKELRKNCALSYFIPTADKVITESLAQLLFFLFEQTHDSRDVFSDFKSIDPILGSLAGEGTKGLNYASFCTWLSSLLHDENEIDVVSLLKSIQCYASRFHYEAPDMEFLPGRIRNPHLYILNLVETTNMNSDVLEEIENIRSSCAYRLRADHREIYSRVAAGKEIRNKEMRAELRAEKAGLKQANPKNLFSRLLSQSSTQI